MKTGVSDFSQRSAGEQATSLPTLLHWAGARKSAQSLGEPQAWQCLHVGTIVSPTETRENISNDDNHCKIVAQCLIRGTHFSVSLSSLSG